MRHYFTKEKLQYILLVVAIITIIFIGLYALKLLSAELLRNIGVAAGAVITPFSIALLLSFIFGPLARLIEAKLHIPKLLSIILSITVGIIFVTTIIVITFVFMVTQMTTILSGLLNIVDNQTIAAIIDNIVGYLSNFINETNLREVIDNLQSQGFSIGNLTDIILAVLAALASITSSIISIGFTVILTPVFLYYLIKERTLILTTLSKVFPEHIRTHVVALGKRSDVVIRGYLRGQGIVMLFITGFFILSYGILAIFVPHFTFLHAVLFALLMGLFCVIPYIGVWISMAAPILLLTTLHLEYSAQTPYIYIVGIIMIFVFNIIEEILESSVIQPNVYSRQVHIHPIAVLSSFIFFGGIFGLAGFILSVPIAGTIKVFLHYYGEINSKKTSQRPKAKFNDV